MEKSQWPKRLSKQGYSPDSSQWNQLRFSSIEQIMEYEDKVEERIRHSYSKQATRSKQGAMTLAGGLGEQFRVQEDEL